MVLIKKLDNVWIKIICEDSILYELSDRFTFFAQNYKYHPRYKARQWDGKIRLLNLRSKTLYAGLIHYVEQFCKEKGYDFSVENDNGKPNFSVHEAKQFIQTLNLPSKFEIRDYQLETVAYCIRNERVLLVSPTSSGKSISIYQLIRYYNKPTLIIVPRIALIQQMISDFSEYGMDTSIIHPMFADTEKHTEKPIVITTWQSAFKMPKEWFNRFEIMFGDEAHNFKAASLISIMTKLTNCPIRFGFTGTLDNIQSNKITLEGLFGPYKKIISTSELMEANHIVDLKIKIILLSHSDENKDLLKRCDYVTERSWLASYHPRNRFIKNLALSIEGNTLILFRLVNDHGIPLHEYISKEAKDRNVYLVHGKTDVEQREYIRKIVNNEKNAIIIASMGTFSEGINIPSINNIIFASPTKSRIAVMQMIGRSLRKNEGKTHATLFDIADDLSRKKWINHTLKHLKERIKYYNEEKFNYKIYKVNLK